ncbi:hypothetical protein UJ101_02200 [Flavobacteriaceae bacterium UJ101]|nr:hypothetical protein UJ101_02200 [Flavobacteriaceae bacterium UJ101]
MKKLFSVLLVTFLITSYAQERYQYVIIPNEFDGFNNKENPYGLSSSTHYLLKKRSIKTINEKDLQSFQTPCEGLKVNIKNVSSMFKNKVRFILENCNGTEVYSAEGKGKSKEFREGYTEALQEAMAGLQTLPYIDNGIKKEVQVTQNANPAVVPVIVTPPVQGIIETEEDDYEPTNLYFNNTYMLDLVEENGKKQLKAINGTLLGYKKLQNIATLSPSGIDDTYLIQWITPNGQTINGMAKFSGKELQISLPSDKGNKLIKVKKP